MRYLESVKHIVPADMFAFVASFQNFYLSSPNSLHDARLEEWRIAEVARPNDRGQRLIEIMHALIARPSVKSDAK